MYKSIKECIEKGEGFKMSPKDFKLNTMATYQARLSKELGRKVILTYNGDCVSEVVSAVDTSALADASNKVKSGLELSIRDREEVFKCIMEIKEMAYPLGLDISIDTVDEDNDE